MLEILKKTRGLYYKAKMPDGSEVSISQGEFLEEIFQYMRSQTQLVVGHAVLPGQLRNFLKANGLEKEM
jgi:hypothetical protein